MKILCCHNRYRTRSGEDIAFDTAVALWRQAGHEVCTFERDNAALARNGIGGQIRVAKNMVFDGTVYAELAELAKEFRPDVAVIQNTFPLLSLVPYRLLAARKVPVVQVLYNYRFLCLNGELYTGGKICERCAPGNYLHGIIRRCYRSSVLASAMAARVAFANRRQRVWESTVALYVAPDRFLGEKLVQYGLPRERFRVIPNPIRIQSGADLGSHDGSVLYVGRWIRAKGIFTLLDAACEPGTPPIFMVGDGEERSAVRAHPAVRNGRVTLLGPLYGRSLKERLRSVAALVAPSEWYDNLPMVVSQAFAAGRPVVASRINGIPEYVRHEVNGLLVPPGDAKALAGALREIGRDLGRWQALAAAARETAEQEMAESRWQSRWDDVFAELCA